MTVRIVPEQASHAELCQVARRWLYGAGGCKVVFVECGTGYAQEMPDALGFGSYDDTVLIECKASRSDFRSDRSKPFRQAPAKGMGARRYFLTPAHLIAPTELPDGWGLLWWYPGSGRVLVKRQPMRQPDRHRTGELALLFAAAQRVVLRGYWHLIETGQDRPHDPDPQPLPVPLESSTEDEAAL